MKIFQILLILSLFNISISAQTTIREVSGVYEMKIDATNGRFIDSLTLNSDGTFDFHEYIKIEVGLPQEKDTYGKGKWKLEKNIILFLVDKNDLDVKHNLNFNNSKARFITKSPRDKSERIIKTSIQFYDSEIFWITGRTLSKLE